MRDLSQKMSPTSWAFTVFCFIPVFVLVLRPTVFETLLMLGVDYCAFRLIIAWESRYLVRSFPFLAPYKLGAYEPTIGSFSTEALTRLFHALQSFTDKGDLEILPLHPSELIAKFEQTFNLLEVRLIEYERELSEWVFNRAEKSRRGNG